MSKLILLILMIFITSCNNSDDVTITKEQYNKLIGDTIKSEYPKPFYFINGNTQFTWKVILDENNHEFLENNGGNAYVIIHNPECRKCINRLKHIIMYHDE